MNSFRSQVRRIQRGVPRTRLVQLQAFELHSQGCWRVASSGASWRHYHGIKTDRIRRKGKAKVDAKAQVERALELPDRRDVAPLKLTEEDELSGSGAAKSEECNCQQARGDAFGRSP